MSNLLKIYKALEDEELGKRVQGAVVKQAQYFADTEPGGSAENFARTVLDDPFQRWIEMHVYVVTNVMEDAISQADGSIYTGNIPDSKIEYVVGASWNKVANKYAPESE